MHLMHEHGVGAIAEHGRPIGKSARRRGAWLATFAVTARSRLYGSCSCAGEYPEAIRRIQDGSIQVEPLLSAVAPLDEGAGWFQRLYDNKEGLMKVVLKP